MLEEGESSNEQWMKTEDDFDIYCKRCGSSTMHMGVLKHADFCVYFNEYLVVKEEETEESDGDKQTQVVEGMKEVDDISFNTYSGESSNKQWMETEDDFDIYCEDCGSDTIHEGILKHADFCVYFNEYWVLKKAETIESGGDKKTQVVEGMNVVNDIVFNKYSGESSNEQSIKTEEDVDIYCEECGSDAMHKGILKHADGCVYFNEHMMVNEEESEESSTHKQTKVAEGMSSVVNDEQSVPYPSMAHNINPLCRECGSFIMHDGVILHSSPCRMANDLSESVQKKCEQDVCANVSRNIPTINKRNPLCRECGSLSLCNGLVVHLSSCRLANKKSYRVAQMEFEEDINLKKKRLSARHSLAKTKQNKGKQSQNTKNHNDTHDQKCSCKICSDLTKIFLESISKNPNDLNYHTYGVTIKDIWMCNCGKVLSSKKGLIQHIIKLCRSKTPLDNPNSSTDSVSSSRWKSFKKAEVDIDLTRDCTKRSKE